MKKVIMYNPRPSALSGYVGAPLAILSVCGALDKEGYDIKILTNTGANIHNKIKEYLEGAICFGITSMTGYQISDGLKIAKIVREIAPDLPIIWGGWHPTLLPEQTIKNKYVDIVVRGPGEKAFTEIVHALENNLPLDGILGISFKKNNSVVSNPVRPIGDINDSSPLPYHLIDVEKHIFNSEMGSRTINYISSQGCPFGCRFCAEITVYERKWSGLSAERVVQEIETLVKKYNINGIVFADNNFFVNENRVIEISKGLIEKKINIQWGQVNGKADRLVNYKKETWELLKKSGLYSLIIGAESGSQQMLDFICKGAKVEDTITLAKMCKEHNIVVLFSFFIGLPTKENLEDKKSIKREFELDLELIDQLMEINEKNLFLFFIYTPYPGNPIYEIALQHGVKEPEKFEDWANFELNLVNLPWVPKKYGRLTHQFNILYFPFLSDQIKNIVNNYGTFRIPAKICYSIIHSILKFRWKHRFFSFPIEYYTLKMLFKLKHKEESY